MDQQEFQSVVFEDFNEQYMYFSVWPCFSFFGNTYRERKDAGLKVLTSLPKQPFTSSSLPEFPFRSRLRQTKGYTCENRAFRRGDLEKALLDYTRAAAKDSASLKAKYNMPIPCLCWKIIPRLSK